MDVKPVCLRAVRFAMGALLLASPLSIQAAAITFTTVTATSGWSRVAVDGTTGKFYDRPYGSAAVSIYDDEASFANGIASSSFTPLGGAANTQAYYGARNGKYFARTNTSNTTIGRWASDGSLEQTASGIPGMGIGGTDIFDYAIYQAMNWMSDRTGLYVVGGAAANNDWQISTVDPTDLGNISSLTYTPTALNASGRLGYGFIINGHLFTGLVYNTRVINDMIDIASGVVSSVSYDLVGLGSGGLSHFQYDWNNDTLYAYNDSNKTLYKAIDASVQFGVEWSQAPTPTPLLLVSLGIAGLACRRRSTA